MNNLIDARNLNHHKGSKLVFYLSCTNQMIKIFAQQEDFNSYYIFRNAYSTMVREL